MVIQERFQLTVVFIALTVCGLFAGYHIAYRPAVSKKTELVDQLKLMAEKRKLADEYLNLYQRLRGIRKHLYEHMTEAELLGFLTEAANNSGLRVSLAEPRARKSFVGYVMLTVHLGFIGDYASVSSFLTRLERHDKLIIINKCEMQALYEQMRSAAIGVEKDETDKYALPERILLQVKLDVSTIVRA